MRKRDLIAEAADQELLKHGFAGASLSAIAEQVGRTKGALTYCFAARPISPCPAPEPRRGPFKDFIGALEFTDRLLEFSPPARSLVVTPARTPSSISDWHPGAHRFVRVAELVSDAHRCSLARTELRTRCTHHPNRSGLSSVE